jgi:hypothetical protein
MQGWLETKINEGFTWRTIKPLLRLDPDIFNLPINSLTDIPQELLIHYQFFYNLLHKKVVSESQKDSDEFESLVKWCDILRNKNYKVLFETSIAISNAFVIAWVSPWQFEMFSTHSKVVCLDTTHDTCVEPLRGIPMKERPSCYLSTIVAKSIVTGKGIPLAFMITNKKDR